jgi:hypothetical protein
MDDLSSVLSKFSPFSVIDIYLLVFYYFEFEVLLFECCTSKNVEFRPFSSSRVVEGEDDSKILIQDILIKFQFGARFGGREKFKKRNLN